jgi:dTDP-4-dehydrorhamnose reductase
VDLAASTFKDAVAIKPDVAFLCAAMTNIKACHDDPVTSSATNIAGTVKLASELIEGGCFVVFLSSNTVFDGITPWPAEHSPYAPTTEYGRQKMVAEQQLLALPGADRQIAIVRLSKVLSGGSGIGLDFMNRLRHGEQCRPFSDILMSPVSVRYVNQGLIGIALKRASGLHHLSGAEEISYADFSRRLAEQLAVDPALIEPITSRQAGIEVHFQPLHPGLGMPRTTKTLGIAPETVENVLLELRLSGRNINDQ